MSAEDHPDASGGNGLHASSARIAAAAALRRFGHSIVARDVDDATFERIVAQVEELAALVDRFPVRRRPVDAMKQGLFTGPPVDGETIDHFPDCIVSGQANPLGIAMRVVRDGGDALARVTLGPAFEGAPDRAHGGVVAAVFDDTMGFVLGMERTPAYTGQLSVTYRAATPVGEELEFRARLHDRRGRKLRVRGEATHGDVTIAEAEGLFIAIDLDKFAKGHLAAG